MIILIEVVIAMFRSGAVNREYDVPLEAGEACLAALHVS
jgi:hypothetical protein